MSRSLFVTIVMLLVLHAPAVLWGTVHASEGGKSPVKTVESQRFKNGVIQTKKVRFPNGDMYWMKRVEFAADQSSAYRITIPLSGSNGTFRYIDRSKAKHAWATIPLRQTLPQPSGFIQTNQTSLLLNASNYFSKNRYGTIEKQPNPLPIKVISTEHGYVIQVDFPQKKHRIAEVWGVESAQPLVDWNSNPNLQAIWLLLDLQEYSKWSWDGYYVKTPGSYTPHSPSIYWRLPANYAAQSFVITGGSRAADDLGWVMLDTILPNQNRDGYWESMPRSEWLWKDYGIGPGFFDTRFNTDMALLLLKGYQKYGNPAFLQAAVTYSNYLLKHIEKHHVAVAGESVGWLVADYAWKLPHKKTHVSLNHQLHEMNFLYQMYGETNHAYYKEFAEKLLYGVKNSKRKWIKPNHDLHYAFRNNGSMGLPDYPYLTYNDLVESQYILTRMYGEPDPDLAELMASKKRWMDQTGVKGYRTSPITSFPPASPKTAVK